MRTTVILLLYLAISIPIFAQQTDSVIGDEVYVIVETLPEFPGGEEGLYDYLRRNLVYPRKARKAGQEGVVIVKFMISKEGKVENIEVVQSVGQEIDEAAIKLVRKMPDWKPGTQRGKPVDAYFNLPLRFTLRKG